MPKLKPEELAARRTEIIEAARACFLRSGFHQTTTDEICHEASITPGGLYHYFDSKEEIISAVIENAARSSLRYLTSVTESASDVRSATRELATFLVQMFRDPDVDEEIRFDIEIWAETLRNEKLAAITKEIWGLRRQWMESHIARAREDGMYSEEVDPRAFADLLGAIMVGLRVGKLLWRGDFDVEGAVQSLFLMHAGRLSTGRTDLPQKEAPASGGKGSASAYDTRPARAHKRGYHKP